MKRRTDLSQRGFALVLTVLWVMVLSSLAILLHLRVELQVRSEAEVERQLYSQVLAENGVEYARTVLPHLELTGLLAGQDGHHEGTGQSQWRNPVPFTTAQTADAERLRIRTDDGVPPDSAGQPLLGGRSGPGNGHFFLRFSNNPEEAPDRDLDKIVLVRSMGIAAGRLHNPFSPRYVNSVTLVEARFRQERAFDLPSPLICFGDSGSFRWQGEFSIDGGERPAVGIVEVRGDGLRNDFLSSLEEGQKTQLRGGSLIPSVEDLPNLYRGDPSYRALFRPGFWSHFEEHLPSFADLPGDGLRFLPHGGRFEGQFQGLLVVRGPFRVERSATIRGLLIHLGGGRLELNGRVEGGVWLSAVNTRSESLQVEPLKLSVGDEAAVIYSRPEIERALGRIPPTQLGWRILFPEMPQ